MAAAQLVPSTDPEPSLPGQPAASGPVYALRSGEGKTVVPLTDLDDAMALRQFDDLNLWT